MARAATTEHAAATKVPIPPLAVPQRASVSAPVPTPASNACDDVDHEKQEFLNGPILPSDDDEEDEEESHSSSDSGKPVATKSKGPIDYDCSDIFGVMGEGEDEFVGGDDAHSHKPVPKPTAKKAASVDKSKVEDAEEAKKRETPKASDAPKDGAPPPTAGGSNVPPKKRKRPSAASTEESKPECGPTEEDAKKKSKKKKAKDHEDDSNKKKKKEKSHEGDSKKKSKSKHKSDGGGSKHKHAEAESDSGKSARRRASKAAKHGHGDDVARRDPDGESFADDEEIDAAETVERARCLFLPQVAAAFAESEANADRARAFCAAVPPGSGVLLQTLTQFVTAWFADQPAPLLQSYRDVRDLRPNLLKHWLADLVRSVFERRCVLCGVQLWPIDKLVPGDVQSILLCGTCAKDGLQSESGLKTAWAGLPGRGVSGLPGICNRQKQKVTTKYIVRMAQEKCAAAAAAAGAAPVPAAPVSVPTTTTTTTTTTSAAPAATADASASSTPYVAGCSASAGIGRKKARESEQTLEMIEYMRPESAKKFLASLDPRDAAEATEALAATGKAGSTLFANLVDKFSRSEIFQHPANSPVYAALRGQVLDIAQRMRLARGELTKARVSLQHMAFLDMLRIGAPRQTCVKNLASFVLGTGKFADLPRQSWAKKCTEIMAPIVDMAGKLAENMRDLAAADATAAADHKTPPCLLPLLCDLDYIRTFKTAVSEAHRKAGTFREALKAYPASASLINPPKNP